MAAAHYYRILGLRTGADFEAVKLAYRNLARLYHPDVNPGDHLAKEKFVQITQAYQAIADALPAGVSKISRRTTTTADSTASQPAPPSAAKPVPSTPTPSASSRGTSTRSATTQSATTQSATTQSATTNSATKRGAASAAQPSIQQPPGGSEADQDLKQSSFTQLQSFLQNQRYPRAVALVEGLAHRFPNDPEIRQWHAITYYRWGQAAIGDGNFTKAAACLKKAARLDPLNRTLQQSLQQEWQRLADLSQHPTVGARR